VPYSIPVQLRKEQYNADKGSFEIEFKVNKLLITVERDQAKEPVERKAGKLKCIGFIRRFVLEN